MEKESQFPFVLLAFNRPDLTERVFERIRQWKPTQLIVVVDGPRPDRPEDSKLVDQVRSVISKVDWPCTVTEDFSQENVGLKSRISSALTAVFEAHEAAIILEDDCVPDPSFFRFANELLEKYKNDAQVGIIGGTSRLRGKTVSPYSYDFSEDVRIWGWATWARTWRGFIDSGDLEATWNESEKSRIVESFPQGPRRQAIATMMEKARELDSWALPFGIHCRSQSYLSVVPEVNLVENVGFGARSTHTAFEDYVSQVEATSLSFPLRHPPSIELNPMVDEVENLMDARVRILYPLRHPWDVLRRLLRYFRFRLSS